MENPPGLFFRPFGFLVYWWNYAIAGEDPRLWHLANLIFHASSASLLYQLSKSSAAAFLFALSAAAVEPATWIDARFDPMATALVLASLVLTTRFLDTGGTLNLVAAALSGLAAFATKESAFCLPLLVACLYLLKPTDKRRMVIALLTVGTLATLVFAYRFWALSGLGGYRGAAGESGIQSFSLIRALNAIFIRDWTILFFPINWSTPLNFALKSMLALTPLALAVIVWKSKPNRRVVLAAIAMTTVAALPVQHLLLIGVDLANTRYLYLPAVGWAILWGAIFAGIRRARTRYAAVAWMLALHVVLAQHNLQPWIDASEQARQVCTDFGKSIQGNAVVEGLPQRKNGAVFLANGFPQCVEMNANVPEGRVSVFGRPNYRWDAKTEKIEAK